MFVGTIVSTLFNALALLEPCLVFELVHIIFILEPIGNGCIASIST